jgi:hypothetical protein
MSSLEHISTASLNVLEIVISQYYSLAPLSSRTSIAAPRKMYPNSDLDKRSLLVHFEAPSNIHEPPLSQALALAHIILLLCHISHGLVRTQPATSREDGAYIKSPYSSIMISCPHFHLLITPPFIPPQASQLGTY